MANLVLVEDHALLAEVLRHELESMDMALQLVQVGEGVEANLAELDQPDLVLLDHDLGEGLPTGDQLVKPLVDRGLRVAMLTGVTDHAALGRCLRAGAIGVIHKRDPFDRLIEQIELALRGEPIGPCAAERADYLASAAEAERASAERDDRLERLTSREQEVLRELVQGRSVAEIAGSSFVAVSTVRSQVKSLRRKLEARSQSQLVAIAAEAGWFTDER